MLDIMAVRPKIRQKAVFVTEENVKEFLKFAYPGEFILSTLKIDRNEDPYIYATVAYNHIGWGCEDFILNRWYVSSETNSEAWNDDDCFEDNYEIESHRIRSVE